MPLLVDLAGVSDDACCGTLEDIAKALSQAGDGPGSMWRPLENRWARPLAEMMTVRFRAILEKMEAALARFLGGNAAELRKADVPWLRWDEARFEAVRARLESLDPARMTMEDFGLLVDYLIQRYLPEGVIDDLADYLSVRAVLLGKIQTNLETDSRVGDATIEALAARLPVSAAAVPAHVLTPLETAILAYGRAHAAENIRHITDDARHRMAQICLEHVEQGLLGAKEGTWAYAKQRLFDEFGVLNRDFRRIAVTESGEMVNQGYVAATAPGRFLRRSEAYVGACPFCRSINGKVFKVVAPDDPARDGETDIWVGKSNVGRSAAPMRREGGLLVERSKSELWWPAAGVQHPHCRGAWTPVTAKPPEVSQAFFDYLQAALAQVGPPA